MNENWIVGIYIAWEILRWATKRRGLNNNIDNPEREIFGAFAYSL